MVVYIVLLVECFRMVCSFLNGDGNCFIQFEYSDGRMVGDYCFCFILGNVYYFIVYVYDVLWDGGGSSCVCQ